MKKTNYGEMIGILSLSLLLTISYSISGSLPDMFQVFSSYSRTQVEYIVSVPAFAMVVLIALNPVILKYFSERLVISSGLILFGVSGIIPVFIHAYPVVLVSRILLGAGTGLVNGKAVSMISERYAGEQKAKLTGVRMSMETIGQASMTFVAGQLLLLGWNYSFLIYAIAFPILVIYLLFVPERKLIAETDASSDAPMPKMGQTEKLKVLYFALLAFVLISCSAVISIRMPALIVERNIGTATQGATVLSISIICGFFSGILYGKVVGLLKKNAMPAFLILYAIGLLFLFFGQNYFMMVAGSVFCGYSATGSVSYMFDAITEGIPATSIGVVNTCVLVGCNIGAFSSPMILGLIGKIIPGTAAGFMVYAVILFVISIIIKVERA